MNKKQSSETLKIALLLTFIGGFLEIYSFLLKGKVFATTITGNIILMMYNIYNLNFLAIPKYLFPIIFFSLGIYVVEKIRKQFFYTNFHWRIYILGIEMLLIIIIFIFRSEYFNLFTTCLIAFLSAAQIQTFKKTSGAVYMSTMCTGNTKKLIEAIILKDKKSTKIFSSIIASFSTGVIFAALLIDLIGASSILIVLIPLSIIILLLHKNI